MAKSKYEIVKAWRKRNKDKVAAQARRYRERYPDKVKAIRERHRANNLETIRERDKLAQRERRSKNPEAQRLRVARFKKKVEAERVKIAGRPRPDVCELCGEKARTVFDHCHLSGNFRGWICDRCNRVLGSVKDDIMLMNKMINYLEKADGSTVLQNKKEITEGGVCSTLQENGQEPSGKGSVSFAR